MYPNRLGAAVRRRLAAFVCAKDGNVAMMFALAAIPIIGFTGAAIDYSRASSVRAAMQAALDATALAMSKEAPSVQQDQLEKDAKAYFAATFNRPEAQNINVSATYSTTGGSKVTITGSGSIQTQFLGILGFESLPVFSSSQTTWSMSRLRVALVLDNTGSMSEAGKMTALKSAAKSLLTQLQTAAVNPGDVYVSIVPFVKDVNLDPSNYNASWIDWTDWDNNNGTCSVWARHPGKSNCSGTWTPADHQTWNGCVVDRGLASGPSAAGTDTNVTAPSKGKADTLFLAEQYSECPQAVIGLGYNWTAMNGLINHMSPNGNTNQGIGLALGWMSLAGGGPFMVPPMDPNYQYTQVIILLSDGLNTENRWYNNASPIDARQKKTCDNIKAAGIQLYTIQVNTGGDAKSSVLQNCASSSDKFFYLTSASQLADVFDAIGTKLSRLRIAR